MEKLRVDYKHILLPALILFFAICVCHLLFGLELPLIPAVIITIGAFTFTATILYFASRLYFSREGCLFKNIRGEEFFIKWEDMKLQIREKNAKDKSYFISFGPNSFSYLVGVMHRKSFFILAEKYAPKDHPIRRILSNYIEDYGYKP